MDILLICLVFAWFIWNSATGLIDKEWAFHLEYALIGLIIIVMSICLVGLNKMLIPVATFLLIVYCAGFYIGRMKK